MTLYGSDTDTTAVSSDSYYPGKFCLISSLTSSVNASVFILAPQYDLGFDTQVVEDINGNRQGFVTRRPKFTIESYPFKYDAVSGSLEQDIDDLIALSNVVNNYKFLYLQVKGGSRTYPNNQDYVYPVTLTDWSTSINKEYGTRQVTFTFEMRKRA